MRPNESFQPPSIFTNLKHLPTLLLLLVISSQDILAEDSHVGLRLLQIPDTAIQKDIEVAVWYPSDKEARPERIGPLQLTVSLDSEPSVSKSLIIISHGFSGSKLGHNNLAQYLAKQGYFVVTPTHPDIPGLNSKKPGLDPLVLRPRQIQLILEYFLSSKQEFKSAGVIGYSLGGYTALLSAGALPVFDNLDNYCSEKKEDELLCASWARQRLSFVEKNLSPFQDSRIKALVLLAPGYGPLFTRDSFEKLSVPVRMFSAEKDEELDNDYHANYLAKLLPGDVKHEVIKGAGHYTFMAPCSESVKQKLPSFICNDPAGIDRVALHLELNKQIHEFLNEVL